LHFIQIPANQRLSIAEKTTPAGCGKICGYRVASSPQKTAFTHLSISTRSDKPRKPFIYLAEAHPAPSVQRIARAQTPFLPSNELSTIPDEHLINEM
jgi:hypothetical protein